MTTHPTQDKQELLKQNFELTLIIIFIGLAFGLVGLVVPTAAVMSVVVISVGVIVGFVSYRDAFLPKLSAEVPVRSPVVTPQVPSAPVVAKLPATPQVSKPEPKPTQPLSARPVQQTTPKPTQTVEPLPRLPKIQRIQESPGTALTSQVKPTNTAPPQPNAPTASDAFQAKDNKPRKPRTRKTVEVANPNDGKNA